MAADAEKVPLERRQAEFWGTCSEQESFHHETTDEALEEYCGGFLDGEVRPGTFVRLIGVARMELPPLDRLCSWLDPLERVLEELDDEFASDESTKPTPAMQEAARAFVAAVADEYVVWASDIVEHRDIDIYQWCQEHRPELCRKESPDR